MARVRLGRSFGWLWAAYAVSAYGSGLGFGAFALLAVNVLHAGPTAVAALPTAGLAVGALVAVPLGPWVGAHRHRPIMIGMDLVRCLAMLSIPFAYWRGRLTFAQLLAVAVVVAAAKIAFTTASGATLKSLVARENLLVATSRFESTTWSSIAVGPPLGGLAVGLFGYMITVLADAVSYLLSALGIGAIRDREPAPVRVSRTRTRWSEVAGGWRYLFGHPTLRALLLNRMFVGALILAPEPLLAILLLRQLGFAPWQYGLAFAVPCVGGFLGSRLARPLVGRFGRRRVLLGAGIFGVLWPVGLAFLPGGAGGLVLVIVIELGVIGGMSLVNPVVATVRLELIEPGMITRALSAWSITTNLTTAGLTLVWGVLAELTSVRLAIGLAGVLLLATPLLLVRAASAAEPCSAAAPVPARSRG